MKSPRSTTPNLAQRTRQTLTAIVDPLLRRPSLALGTAAAAALTVMAATVALHGRARAVGSANVPTPQPFVVTEGTNINLTISPDRRTILFDLQNGLWSLPATGGTATLLTDPTALEPTRPDWSPRGDLVAFQSFAGGTFHLWVMDPDGSGVGQRTGGHGDDREPRFSPDGSRIAFSSDRAFNGTYDVWIVDVATGQLTPVTTTLAATGAGDEFEPTWSPDGAEVAFVSGQGATGTRIEAVNLSTGNRRTVVTAPTGTRLNSPAFSPDGSRVAYLQFANNQSQLFVSGTRVGTSNDVFPFYPQWLSNDQLLYTADGKIRTTSLAAGTTSDVPFQATLQPNQANYAHKPFVVNSQQPPQPVRGIVGPALSPDGRRVAFQALNQLWLMDIGQRPVPLTADTYYKQDPAWSPDGKRLAYSSDKAGTEDLYVLDVTTLTEQRVSSLRTSAEVSAAWSPDGTRLAFQNQAGATFTLDLATGDIQQVIAPLFAPSKPSWSANSKTIAVAALKPYTRRFREGNSQMLTVDVATGNLTYTEFAPFKSTSTRGYDGPVYSPDGTAVAFVMDSLLYVRPVDANGVMTGEARQVNDEVTDAPSWSGDSRQLLYLHNGDLRLISRDGGTPTTVPLDLTWQPGTGGRTVVHAGRVWNGKGPDSVTNVDIVIEGNRIKKLKPRGNANRSDTRYVDATALTVIPGLWESHTHEYIEGKFYGDRLGRLWMAYGFTELMSVGDPAYHAVETRESFSSGARVGPRYFATGEAIDGERVYYNFMRPTVSDAGLDRELERAKALDYDMVKTYVRLPHAYQARAVQFAHDEIGVWAGSHYMYPSVANGEDGQTHVSATTRHGYAYTRSSAGISYEDMRNTWRQPGHFDISTTFNASLYAEDPGMVDDARLVTLNPPWDQLGLRAKRDAAVSTDQTVSLDSLQKEEDTVRSIRRGGGTVLAGTDSPLDNVATALHLNLRAQVKYGLAPWEALQSATLLPARSFGMEGDLGTIESGKLADLTFLAGNPLEDIREAADVSAVMKDGKLFTVEELMRPFTKPATVAAAQIPALPNRVLTPLSQPNTKKYWWHDLSEWNGDECAKR